MISAFIIFLLIFVYLQWLWKRRRIYILAAKVPQFSFCLPFIGHGYLYLAGYKNFNIMKLMSNRANKCGGITTMWAYMEPHFVITNPKYAALVSNACIEKPFFYEYIKPWLGEGLLSGNGRTWNVHRRLISPCFSPIVVDTFQNIFNRQARKLLERLADKAGKGPSNILDELSVTALETICATALGVEDGYLINEEIINRSRKFQRIVGIRIYKPWLQIQSVFKRSSVKEALDRHKEILQNFSRQIVKGQLLKGNEQKIPDTIFKPFYQLINELSNNQTLSKEEIREEVDTIILGGYDTCVFAALYVLIFLGTHITIQNKVYDEIKEIFEGTDRDVTKYDMKRMVYTEAVIYETLRLFPIVPLVGRNVTKDVNIGEYVLPAGSVCMFSIWGMHRTSYWGSDAHEFNPERWLKSNEYMVNFCTFSIGRRACLGKNYAFMSLKTILVHLLRKYKVSADVTKLKFKLDIMLRPTRGHYISFEAR